ncbi:MAG: oligosaccharide flippase family protein [Crocinitomicaceae bacterium]|nr:oligosaccharide flippase family protein [Crocinitomicaceae bacterium]
MLKGIALKTIIYSLGGALPAVAGFILLAPLTHYLSGEVYGRQALYFSFSLLIQIIVTYGLDQYLVRNYVKSNGSAEKSALVSAVVSLIAVFSLVILLFFVLSSSITFPLIFRQSSITFLPYGLLSLLTAFFNALFKVFTNLQIYKEEHWEFLRVNVLNTLLYLIGVYFGLVFFPDTLVGPIGGRFLAGLITLGFVIFRIMKNEQLHFQFTISKDLHKYCLPVLIFGIVMWGMSYGNNYIVNYGLKDLLSVSRFDLLLKFAFVIELFQNGLTSALSPKLFKLWHSGGGRENELDIHQLFNVLTLLFVPLSIVILPYMWPILVRREEYNEIVWLFPLIAIGFSLRGIYNYYVNPIYFMEKTRRLPIIFSISLFIHLVSAYILIRWMGLPGAFISLSISRIVQVILLYFLNRDLSPLRSEIIPVFVVPALYCLLGFLALYILKPGIIFNLVQFILAIVLILLFYKNAITRYLQTAFRH